MLFTMSDQASHQKLKDSLNRSNFHLCNSHQSINNYITVNRLISTPRSIYILISQACKEEERNISVKVFHGATEKKECGVVSTPGAGSTQSDQVYTFSCEELGDSIMLLRGENTARTCEVVVTTGR